MASDLAMIPSTTAEGVTTIAQTIQLPFNDDTNQPATTATAVAAAVVSDNDGEDDDEENVAAAAPVSAAASVPALDHQQQHHQQQQQQQHERYRIALYYCYIPIRNDYLEQHCQFHRNVCTRLSLNGRIRVAGEGINGVLSGLVPDLQEYERLLQQELKQLDDAASSTTAAADADADAAGTSNPITRFETNSDWWEKQQLDMKYCQLRTDLPVPTQLFDTLSVKETKTVVSLVGTISSDSVPETTTNNNRSNKKSRQQRRKQQQQQQHPNMEHQKEISTTTSNNNNNNTEESSSSSSSLARYTEQVYAKALERQIQPAIHLSPDEWEKRLLSQLSSSAAAASSSSSLLQQQQEQEQKNKKVVLLDCRNVYESSVGYFQVPHVDTILTNTRKYSELPQVLVEQADRLAAADQVFMYCTGGVRCERASMFLQSLLLAEQEKKSQTQQQQQQQQPLPQIYQLRGGIQKYLEFNSTEQSLFRGKNFVFDPRRTDPVHNNNKAVMVGRCLVCQEPHDDFDNGAAPCENREARCWNCRILVLICNRCRPTVSCWNETVTSTTTTTTTKEEENLLPRVYCGGVNAECHHMPPVQIITGESSRSSSSSTIPERHMINNNN